MAGFTAIISKTVALPSELKFADKNRYGQESHFKSSYILSEKYCIEHFTHTKFANDKTLQEDDEFVIGMEGVLLNLKQLLAHTQQKNIFELIKHLYQTKGNAFINDLRGDYSGFVYSKNDNKWLVFASPTGSKRMFYAEYNEYIFFASDMREITHLCRSLSLPLNLDSNGAYLLLTYGYMLGSTTLAKEVKRLIPGDFFEINKNELRTSTFFNLSSILPNTDSKEQIIEKVDELFNAAVRLEFEKDNEYNYKHIATLSGGLDSRMTVLVADKLGYADQLNFTFSQSNYLDESISKQIAVDYQHEFLFQSLDNGNFLKNIDKTVYFNDGLILYSGSCHLLKSLENINFDNYGIIHTGMIGDAVLGSFLSQPYAVKPSYQQGAYSSRLLLRIANFAQSECEKYKNEELYKFYGRGFLGAMNGNLYMDIFTQACSPFLDVDFLSYCYSIPDNLKFKQQIYLDWIKEKHPEFAHYRWEKTGVSPLKSNNFKKYFDFYYYQRMKLKLYDRIRKKTKTGMNPFDEWFAKNPSLQTYLANYYDEHISLLNIDLQLKKDCKLLYETGNVNERLQVLTLLGAIKLHFR